MLISMAARDGILWHTLFEILPFALETQALSILSHHTSHSVLFLPTFLPFCPPRELLLAVVTLDLLYGGFRLGYNLMHIVKNVL